MRSGVHGHSSISVTFDKYGKLMPGAQQEAAGLLDAFLARQLGGGDVDARHDAKVTT